MRAKDLEICYKGMSAPVKELIEVARAAQKECDKFNFPDEDRPILHEALEKLKKACPDFFA
jgi:hypothetical protein